MIKHLKLFVLPSSDVNGVYAQVAKVKVPMNIRVTVKYQKTRMGKGRYQEQTYVVNPTNISQMYQGYNQSFVDSASNYDTYANFSHAELNNRFIFFYFGRDISGNTDETCFQILYKPKIINRNYIEFIDVEVEYPDDLSGAIQFVNYDNANLTNNTIEMYRKEWDFDASNLLESDVEYSDLPFVLDEGGVLQITKNDGNYEHVALYMQRVGYRLHLTTIVISRNVSDYSATIYNFPDDAIEVYYDSSSYYIKALQQLYYKFLWVDQPTTVIGSVPENATQIELTWPNLEAKQAISPPFPIFSEGQLVMGNYRYDGNLSSVKPAGNTASRPESHKRGTMYFDTTLGKPIWWSGSEWVDCNGDSV